MSDARQAPEDRRRTTIDTRRLAAERGLELLSQRLIAIERELAEAALQQGAPFIETQSAALREEARLLSAQREAMEFYLRSAQERRNDAHHDRRTSDQNARLSAEARPTNMSALVRCYQCGVWVARDEALPITIGREGEVRLWTAERAAYYTTAGRTPILAYLCPACAADVAKKNQ